MIDKRTIFEIHQLADQGLSERQIARRLHIARPTVRKYLEHPTITKAARSPRVKKLDAYRDYIAELLTSWPEASAVVIKQRLEDRGYRGGISMLRDYLYGIRGSNKQPAKYIRFESPAGQQCQCDWGYFGTLSYGQTSRKLYCMTVIECHSRLLYLEFTHSVNKEAFMRSLLHAFMFFGGTPKELVHDNLKTAVIERVGSIIRFNEDYLHFLLPFHIMPYACGIGNAPAKGKIEKGGIHYVRYNFWPCRRFVGLADVNAQAAAWRDQIANPRVHETTGQVPQHRFRADALRPLPDNLPDTRDTAEAKVHSDCRFKFDANQYSAPQWLVGKTLIIKADHQTVTAIYKNKIVARHPRSWERKAIIENPEHVKELLLTRQKARYTKQQEVYLSMGEPAQQFLAGLAQTQKNLSLAIKRLLELRDQYGTEAIIQALTLAIKYQAYGIDYVENILYQQTRPPHHYERVTVKDATLNELHLPEPDLLIYDAIALKQRRHNHDQT
jgi:transposase